jgi:hypothetical protein
VPFPELNQGQLPWRWPDLRGTVEQQVFRHGMRCCSGVFAATPLVLGLLPAWTPGSPTSRGHDISVGNVADASYALASPSKRLRRVGMRSRELRRTHGTTSASLELRPLECPSSVTPRCCPLPRHQTNPMPLRAETTAGLDIAFHPRGFSPPRRVSPASRLQVLLQPGTGRGSPRFHWSTDHRIRRFRGPMTRSARRTHPSKKAPSFSSRPRITTQSLPSCRSSRTRMTWDGSHTLRAERASKHRHRRSSDRLSIRQTRTGTSTDRISSVHLGEMTLGTLPAEAASVHRVFPRPRKRDASPTRLSRAFRPQYPRGLVAPAVSCAVNPTSRSNIPRRMPTSPTTNHHFWRPSARLPGGRTTLTEASVSPRRARRSVFGFPSLPRWLPCAFARGDA